MAGVLVNFTKTFFVPALIALVIYILLTFAVLPLYRNHYQRYSQYIPLSALSERTSSIWTRSSRLLLKILPASLQRRSGLAQERYESAINVEDGGLFDEEVGEGLVGFNMDDSAREAMTRSNLMPDTQRRLSRDLEEGFRDDSDEETQRSDDR